MSEGKYEIVIGLEVHVQLKTFSKLFCTCKTKFGALPNENTCPVCLGLPGVLPVLNEKAVKMSLKTACALDCEINRYSKFDRKNYYYPDLPKNYQISQYDKPIGEDGFLEFIYNGKLGKIRIKRVHLEEDAGKLIHADNEQISFVDFNRTGIPLLEIVSEPDITSPEEAYYYLTSLKQVIGYIKVSDCNMEEGSLRCDANISLREKGQTILGTKTEVKNMNSFKAVLKALSYEAKRQEKQLSSGEKISQETRLWNPDKEKTISMRSKEEAHDYRYFPEPDLVPLNFNDALIEGIRKSIPEMPLSKKNRFIKEYKIPEYNAEVLTSSLSLSEYYESAVSFGGDPKMISNWIMSELLRDLNRDRITPEKSPISSKNMSRLVQLISEKVISGKIAKKVFNEMYKTGDDPEKIIKKNNLVQIKDENVIEQAIERVIYENPDTVKDFQNGKDNAIMYLIGQTMKATRGKANPGLVQKMLRQKLKNEE